MASAIRALLIAACVGFLAAGCAVSPPRPAQAYKVKDCDSQGPCVVGVSVGLCGGVYCILADPEVIVVRNKSKIDITWELTNAPGYKFSDNDGIVFESKDFDCKKDGEKFKCRDNHTNGRVEVYKYSIHLSGAFPLSYDPWVVND